MSDWLNPLNRIKIQDAIRNKKTELKISDKEIYILDYSWQNGYVWIQHKFNFAPCGVFNLKSVLNPEWIVM